MLDPAGALHWPATGTLVVSDLHLENRSSVARRGMLPLPSDTHATLNRLTLLLRRYRPRLVVVLGGPFHDDDGTPHLPAAALARLTAMTAAHRFIWVHGNHGPTPPAGIGGERVAEFSTARLMFHHTAIPGAIPEGDPRGDGWRHRRNLRPLPPPGERPHARRLRIASLFRRGRPPHPAAGARRPGERHGRARPGDHAALPPRRPSIPAWQGAAVQFRSGNGKTLRRRMIPAAPRFPAVREPGTLRQRQIATTGAVPYGRRTR